MCYGVIDPVKENFQYTLCIFQIITTIPECLRLVTSFQSYKNTPRSNLKLINVPSHIKNVVSVMMEIVVVIEEGSD